MKELIEYETPRASVRGVFLCENLANVISPVKKVTLEEWEAVTPVAGKDFDDLSFQIW
jgi:hypothetical protein